MKKIISLALLLILLLSCVSVHPVQAADPDVTINISQISALQGETVEVFFTIDAPSGIKTLSLLDFAYDNVALTIIESECSWLMDGKIEDIDFENNASIITFQQNTVCSGNILKFVFKINDNAAVGNYPISCSAIATQMLDNIESRVVVAATTGEISVIEPNKYSVVFDGNGATGGSMSNLAMTYDVAMDLTTNTFVKTGYTFIGWNTKADGTGTPYVDGASVINLTETNNGTVTLYAQWEVNNYTVTFDPNGGTTLTVDKKVVYDSTYGTLPTPTKTGHAFNGWYTEANGGTKVTANTKVKTAKDHTLYAQWVPNANIKYVVNHYQMDIAGLGYCLKETVNETGISDASVTIADLKKTYVGFTYEGGVGTTAASTVKPAAFDTTTTVLADGTRIINIYYSRNQYSLSLNIGLGIASVTGAGTYYYGQSVTIDATVSTGYTWSKWSDNNTAKKTTIVMPASNVTLTASATLNDYTITYNLDGGSVTVENPTSYDATTEDFTLNNPARTGYTFDGWIGTGLSTATKTVTIAKGSTGDRTYTATWTANNYTVTFDANGGSTQTASKSVTYDSTYGDLPVPTRIGYTFNGWYTAASDGEQVTAETKVAITVNQILYAYWVPITYTIAFNGNGATNGSVANINALYDETTTLPENTFEKANSTFCGWNTEADGSGVAYADKESVKNLSSTNGEIVTLYAQWNNPQYIITFIPNGGTCSVTSKTVVSGLTYGYLPIPERSGYNFLGWYTLTSGGEEITSESTVQIAEDTYLYAQWSAKTFVVTFDANGGQCDTESKTVTYRSLYGTLPVPTRSGYEFTGWYTEKENETKITADTKVTLTDDIVLYAHWRVESYNITLDPNGGESSVTSKQVKYSLPYGELPVPTRTGYTFNGWFTDVSYGTQIIETSTVMSEAPHTLYAHWTVEHYSLILSGNGIIYTGIDYDQTYDEAVNGGLPQLTKDGYTFLGWFTEAEGGVQVTSDMKCVVAGDHTLYAQWLPHSFTVSFDAVGGSCIVNSKTVIMGSGYGELPTPNKEGYDFKGWYTASSGGAKVAENTIVSTPANHTLYARWEAKTYVIKYEANGGTISINTQSKTHGVPYVLIDEEPIREGYIFMEWNTAEDGSGVTYDPATVLIDNADVVFYAQWHALSYTVTFDPAGGTCDTFSTTVRFGDTYGKLPRAEKEGYVFEGWYLTSKNREMYSFSTVEIAEDHCLTAIWTTSDYYKNIDFDLNYDEITVNMYGGTYKKESNHINLSTEDKEGFKIIHSHDIDYDDVPISEAVFTPQAGTYRVTVEVLSGTIYGGKLVFEAVTHGEDKFVIEMENDGLYRTVWNLTEEQAEGVYSLLLWGDCEEQNALYFDNLKFRIKVEKIDDINAPYTFSTYRRVIEDVGFYADNISVPTRDGYVFTGWYTHPVGGERLDFVYRRETGYTVYAHWEKLLELKEESTLIYEKDNKFVYGQDLLTLNQEQLGNQFVNQNLAIIPSNAKKVGTGSAIQLFDETGSVYEIAQIIIFGDINGDGWYDGQDAVIVACLVNGMLTQDDVSEAVYMAADCNHDGAIDQIDVDLLNKAGALISNIDQTEPVEELETNSFYVEYVGLIDQTSDVVIDIESNTGADIEFDEPIPTPDNDTTPEQDEIKAEISIFEMIINFIKSIFEMLLAYIPVPLK